MSGPLPCISAEYCSADITLASFEQALINLFVTREKSIFFPNQYIDPVTALATENENGILIKGKTGIL